jgi:hypothetical protein
MTIDLGPMSGSESEATSRLIRGVIETLPYYNERARAEECAKYTSKELLRATREDPMSVLVARTGAQVVGPR